jgi:hypothetical protein
VRQGRSKRGHSKIFAALGAVHTINEGRQIDQLAPGIHEIKVENLLAHHIFFMPNIMAL